MEWRTTTLGGVAEVGADVSELVVSELAVGERDVGKMDSRNVDASVFVS